MKAVILAAGKGTRMRELTKDTPKPLLRIRNKNLLEINISAFKNASVNEFIFVTGYLSEKIESYFGDGTNFGCSIEYVHQEKQNGTGSALNLCRDLIGDSDFFMTYADVINSAATYNTMKEVFRQEECDIITTVNWVDDPTNGAAVYLSDVEYPNSRRVIDIIEKPRKGKSTTHWNNSGAYIFSPLIFQYTEKLLPSSRGEYELTEAVKKMIDDKKVVHAVETKEYWFDVGTPEILKKINEMILKFND